MHIGLQDWASEIDMRKLTLAEITLLGTYTYTQADLRPPSARWRAAPSATSAGSSRARWPKARRHSPTCTPAAARRRRSCCSPERARIHADWFVRGGIRTTVTVEHRARGWKPAARVELPAASAAEGWTRV
jgi:hypothetical protein